MIMSAHHFVILVTSIEYQEIAKVTYRPLYYRPKNNVMDVKTGVNNWTVSPSRGKRKYNSFKYNSVK